MSMSDWGTFLNALPDGGPAEREDFLLELLLQLTTRTPLDLSAPPLPDAQLAAYAVKLRADWFGA